MNPSMRKQEREVFAGDWKTCVCSFSTSINNGKTVFAAFPPSSKNKGKPIFEAFPRIRILSTGLNSEEEDVRSDTSVARLFLGYAILTHKKMEGRLSLCCPICEDPLRGMAKFQKNFP